MSVPSLSWQVFGMLAHGGLTLLYGPPGSGKTTLGVGLACSWATEVPFLGLPVMAMAPVVVVAAEGLAGFRSRLLAWKTYHDLPQWLGVYVVAQAVPLADKRLTWQFANAIEDRAPGLIIFDTLSRCCPGVDENDAGSLSAVIDNVDFLRRRLGAAALLVHHSTKSAGNTERGSGVLKGACDTVLCLNDSRVLSCEKQRDGEPFNPLRVVVVPVAGTDGCVVELADKSTVRLTGQQTRALASLRAFGSAGCTSAEWQQAAGLKRRTYYDARDRLTGFGYVRKSGAAFVAIG